MGDVKKYVDVLFKVVLLAIGFADFFGALPDSLDILDKVLTSLILAYFWYQLKLSSFLFGKRKKWLDYTILISFYILVLDSFMQLIRIIDLHSSFAQGLNSIFSHTPFIKSFFLFLHNPVNASFISGFSFFGGFFLLLLIALYAAIKMTYGKKSVMHSFARLFIKEDKWKNFADTHGTSIIIKFILSFIVLVSIYQYFFALVNQWFVVSLDKSLLILAILYAVKDISGTKSASLNKLGNFDNWLLKGITDLFTNHKKFYLGFSVLLVFHMLSDLATFFIPYFLPFIQIDAFYLDFLGDATNLLHQPFGALLTQEVYTSTVNMFIGFILYHLSAIGSLALIFSPLVFLYLLLTKSKISLETKWSKIVFFIILLSSINFFIAPWFTQQPIFAAGIQGVDFTTKFISSSINIIDAFILTAIVFGFLYFKRKNTTGVLGFFVLSTIFFARYILNYFVSSAYYHFEIIAFFFSTNNIIGGIIFIILFLLELLFYIGGFSLLTYHIARLVLDHTPKTFLTTRFTYIWTFVLLVVPLLLMYVWSASSFLFASAIILALLVINYATFKEFTGKEFRDDYLLALTSVIASYQTVLIFRFVLQELTSINAKLIFLIEPIILVALAIFLIKRFNLAVNYKSIKIKKIFKVLLYSIPFVVAFTVINEPSAITLPIFGLLIYTFFVSVSEELFFRTLIFGIANQPFSKKAAMQLQAIAFTLLHIVGIRFVWQHYVANGSLLFSSPVVSIILYIFFLYLFSLVAQHLVEKKGKAYNPVYAILFHWIVNLLVLL